jgi:hypothetical protein
LDQAQVIVSGLRFHRQRRKCLREHPRFAKGRSLNGKDDPMSRLYAVESLFTLTGLNADHRLRVPPSMIVAVLARLALNLLASTEMDAKLKELAAPGSSA